VIEEEMFSWRPWNIKALGCSTWNLVCLHVGFLLGLPRDTPLLSVFAWGGGGGGGTSLLGYYLDGILR